MGLDGVEMIMATEQAFGIEIPDADASRLRTPRLLLDYVAAWVPLVPGRECDSQRIFYRLRRGFRSELAALAPPLGPATPLRTLLHKDQWDRVWTALRHAVGEPYWPQKIPWPGLLRVGPKTIGGLVLYILRHLPAPDGGQPWTRGQLEAALRRIILEETGAEGFRLDADFVRDLSID